MFNNGGLVGLWGITGGVGNIKEQHESDDDGLVFFSGMSRERRKGGLVVNVNIGGGTAPISVLVPAAATAARTTISATTASTTVTPSATPSTATATLALGRWEVNRNVDLLFLLGLSLRSGLALRWGQTALDSDRIP